MNHKVKILLSVLVWIAIFVYLVFAVRYCSKQEENVEISGTKIEILDSLNAKIITPTMVESWLKEGGFELLNKPVNRLNTNEIELAIRSKGFVKDVRVYVDLSGVLNIDIEQRVPIARVNTQNGYNFYITDDHYILPLQSHWVCYVPVISGNMNFPFERDFVGQFENIDEENKKKYAKNYQFCSKLINFVEFVSKDKFWNAQIVQINLNQIVQKTVSELGGRSASVVSSDLVGQVELIPRAGDHIIMLGGLDDYKAKLDKMMRFYDQALKYEGWNGKKYINLAFKDQIVVSN